MQNLNILKTQHTHTLRKMSRTHSRIPVPSTFPAKTGNLRWSLLFRTKQKTLVIFRAWLFELTKTKTIKKTYLLLEIK